MHIIFVPIFNDMVKITFSSELFYNNISKLFLFRNFHLIPSLKWKDKLQIFYHLLSKVYEFFFFIHVIIDVWCIYINLTLALLNRSNEIIDCTANAHTQK